MRVKNSKLWLGGAGLAVLLTGLTGVGMTGKGGMAFAEKEGADKAATAAAPQDPDSVSISAEQAKQVKVANVTTRSFAPKRDAVGYIDFNQDRNVQVFSQYQGRVRQVLVKAGDDVRKGQHLFSIDSPDLVQAESSLISTAGLLALSDKTLERVRKMQAVQAAAQKDVEQAISDQQTADASYKAARDAVRIFGKSDADIDAIVASRKVDGELWISSPSAGRITARNVAPGLLVQPGATPAPFTLTDLSVMWLVANLQEADIPSVHIGAPVKVSVLAWPGRTFGGEVSYIGESIDPNTHRIMVRSNIRDPHHELKQQMMATFVIGTGKAVASPAMPVSGVVREGDGTMTVFTTADGLKFTRHHVQVGMVDSDYAQILSGLKGGEKVAGDGALFLSNALALQQQ